MDRQQAYGIGTLFLRDGLELARAQRLLLGDEADEALDIGTAQLFVRACEPRELAHVRVATPAVPLREHCEVVVVLADDALAETLERQPRQSRREPIEALPKREQQALVALVETGRQRALEPGEERPLRRGATEQRKPVVRQADERRREHAQHRAVVVAVVQEPEVCEQIGDLLLAEVAPAGGSVRRQTGLAQLFLVPLRIGAGGEEEHDFAGGRRARVDELAHTARHGARLGTAPVHPGVVVARLVRDEQLDRMAEDRIRELRAGMQRLELVAEVRAEQLVHRCEHLGARAVIPRQRQQLRRLRAALAEHTDVGVPEPVDRLELVADEEDLSFRAPEQVDELALEAVRVLELVDHDRAEAFALAGADLGVVAQQVARVQLQVFEVERRFARLRLGVRGGEAGQQLLKEDAVACRCLVERRLLDRLQRLLVRRGPLARGAEALELHQPVGPPVALEQREQLRRVALLEFGRARVGGEAARRLAQLLDAALEHGERVDREVQLAAGGTQRLIHAREHPPQPVGAVRRKQAQTVGLAAGAELGERLLERLAAEHGALRVVELAEPRVEARREGITLQQAQAEAVDGRDPGAVQLAREILPPTLGEGGADARAQLAGGPPRICDHEDRVDVEPAVAHGAHEPFHEHGGLAGARAGGDEDFSGRLDGCDLLLVHARSIRQIGQRSHHAGQSPPFGSCTTSPLRMRPASRCAVAFAVSTADQKASSS